MIRLSIGQLTRIPSFQQELSITYVCPQMRSLFPRRRRTQRAAYTSKIIFKGSLMPEDVDPSYARARNPELLKSGTLRNTIAILDEC